MKQDGRANIITPHERLVPGEDATVKPADENQREASAGDTTCVSWRQTMSTVSGREEIHCRNPECLSWSRRPYTFKEMMDKAIVRKKRRRAKEKRGVTNQPGYVGALPRRKRADPRAWQNQEG